MAVNVWCVLIDDAGFFITIINKKNVKVLIDYILYILFAKSLILIKSEPDN